MSEAVKLAQNSRRQVPLCVGLDNTLVKTDTLIELVMSFIKRNPFALVRLLLWSLRGRVHLKSMLATLAGFDPTKLPYNDEIVSLLRQEQMRGRKIILVTGAHRSIAQMVANHLRLFSETYGSHDDLNLVGAKKAAFLVAKYGEKNFDYIGDSSSDLAVWRHAQNCLYAGRSSWLLRRAQAISQVQKIFTPDPVDLATVAKTLRVHQWVKNILVVLLLVFANRLNEPMLFVKMGIAFIAFCLAASAVYIVNDLLDLEADRSHPDKRLRPFAAGDMPLAAAFFLVPGLLVSAFACASMLNFSFQLLLGSYILLTGAYNAWLKQIAIADIVVLASLFSGRLFAGGAAAEISLSTWLIAFTGFFFLSLALVKRCSELIMLENLNLSKPSGRGYLVQDIRLLISLGIASGYISILVMALYLSSDTARMLYERKDFLWAICPLALYWISRIWLFTNRGLMHSDPISFALRDRASWILAIVVGLIWCAAHGYLI